jgi:acetyl-CoA C-acetyltransferase
MGQTAEKLAHLFAIPREAADAYAVESHHRLARAQGQGWLAGEVTAMVAPDGTLHDHDDGVRPDSSVEKLAGLKPAFERPWGKVTAGNSSQITDGASWVILASDAAVERHGLTRRARLIDSEWSALDPSIMGLGPTLASTALLRRHDMAGADVDLWELNEAFAAQVLACLAAWEDEAYCRDVLGLDAAFGPAPIDFQDAAHIFGAIAGMHMHPIANRIGVVDINREAGKRVENQTAQREPDHHPQSAGRGPNPRDWLIKYHPDNNRNAHNAHDNRG